MPPRAPTSRRPATVRIALWSAHHRWPVVAAWFAFTIGLFLLSNAMGGIRTESATSAGGEARTEAGRGVERFEAAGAEDPSEQLVVVITSSASRVGDAAFQQVVADVAARLQAVTVAGPSGQEPALAQLFAPVGPIQPPGLVSRDQTSVRIVAQLVGDDAEIERRLEPLRPVLADIREAHPGYTVRTLNFTLINEDIGRLVNEDLDGSLRLTLPLTFLILLLAFGAVAAALVPLVLAVSALIAAFGLFGIYSQIVGPVSQYGTQLIVLIGLAVAVDYSLFMISRFRAERVRGRDKMASIETASSTAGRAVFFSGLAVVVSLAGLVLMEEAIFVSMALGTISVVLVSVLGSLTFLPAVLSILGHRLEWGRIPYFGRERAEGSGVWSRIVRVVMRRPAVWAAGTTVFLLLLSSPLLHLRLGQTDITAFPESVEGVAAIRQLNEHFPEGTTLNLDVYVTGADRAEVDGAIGEFQAAALGIPGITEHREPRTESRDGSVARLRFAMSGNQNDDANHEIVRRLRTEVAPASFGGLPGVEVFVGGRAASVLDSTQLFTSRMPLVFAFVLTLSFLLLMLAFHSLAIPLKALFLNLLSAGAAYGAMILVFQDGLLSNVTGLRTTSVIEAWVPIFIFTILFGLSMDYHVFILTRVKEARDRGIASNEAVAVGISATSGTVTSAAAIMVMVFAVFVTLRLVIIQQVGLGLAVAVLIDATLIRSVLLPATMRLLGEWNWWMPRWLAWLPRVTIEGEAEEPARGDGLSPADGRAAGA